MISTDTAVSLTSVMGASERLAEMLLQGIQLLRRLMLNYQPSKIF
jgi:FlaA1/EpsC-like NDP-sugar epimerase